MIAKTPKITGGLRGRAARGNRLKEKLTKRSVYKKDNKKT